ncbi:MAG TPA: glycine cleavage system aminomethyltransferase GcvT [Jatrophihabitans sp.]|jgi:aminomethyltransferase
MTDLLHSPLHDRHVALGAKLADFGGWEMPIEYPGAGVLKEHAATRDAVGIFDVSHLGKASIVGRSAEGLSARDFVNSCLTNDLGKIVAGKAQYTLCCNSAGGVIDDLYQYLIADEDVFLVPNAANTAEVVSLLAAAAPEGITVTDRHTEYGVIAVQGPKSTEVLTAVGLPAELEYIAFTDASFDGSPVRVLRTGYTGEHGYELLPTWDGAPALWDALVQAAAPLGGLPAGLGARDTLRTEMGYPLHGHELSPTITPVQASATWAVGWKKEAFWGREALLAEKAAGPARKLWGLLCLDRGIPRGGMNVLAADGAVIGEVTSGTFSPTKRVGIGLALLDTSVGIEEGDEITVDVRGRTSTVRVVKPPFVESRVR